ncbi:MAG: cytochrome b/b6 domain-containing protein [Ahrensia sp.]|nr:cytochrome b/b6 domain-containing protein [Ahrensia sp.]
MALSNTLERYGKVAQIVHWIMAIMIFGSLAAGAIMVQLPDVTIEELELKVFAYSMHKTVGIVLLALALFRVAWAISNPRPKPLHPERRLETFAAGTIHWALYIAILAAPITGLLHHAATTGFAPIWWPFGQDLPFVPKDEILSKVFGAMHWAMAVTIVGSLVLHIGGALKHVFIDKDETLARMVPGRLSDDFSLSENVLRHKTGWMSALLAIAVVGGWVGAVGAFTKQENTIDIAELKPLTINTDQEMTGDHLWKIIPEESVLKIQITQLGSPVEGEFKNWNAKINFDRNDVESAFVDARIDMTSLSVGSVSDQAKSADFLNVTAFPQARFLSDFFWLRGDGRYDAEGILEIAGQIRPFTLVFSLEFESEDRVRMQAVTEINRMDHGVGAEKYGAEDQVAYPVQVLVEITAEREK